MYITRVAIFRQKNYSAEYETRRNRRAFRQNSACFAEEKQLGHLFRTISWKRKTLGIPFQTNLNDKTLEFLSKPFLEEKTSEFRSEPFSEEKNISELYSEPFSEEKTLENPFQTIFGTENTQKTTTFVSSSVKLHYFRGIPLRSVRFRTTKLALLMNTEFRGMSTFFRGITKTFPSLFRGIFSERNFDGNPIYYGSLPHRTLMR
jgi:hypothetical protein